MYFDTKVWSSQDSEKRELRVSVATLKRSLIIQKENNNKLQIEINNWKKESGKLKQENDSLLKKIERIERSRDKYKSLLFKKNSTNLIVSAPLDPESKRQLILAKTKRGGKVGHKAHFRGVVDKLDINEVKRMFLSCCPNCNHKLKRTTSVDSHIIEDIPLEKVQAINSLYEVERQWCNHCHKEVKVNPKFVIPGSRFGINTLVYILILRYSVGLTIPKIRRILLTTYKITISNGGIINQLNLAKDFLKSDYQKILDHVRASPIKHADETTWRINGINTWVWAFLTKDDIYLSIEESRGKAVPIEKLAGSDEQDVLVRDDYVGYKNLNMVHQSCWAHLLKEARFETEAKTATKEMFLLNIKLKDIFHILKIETESPFDQDKRDNLYNEMSMELTKIIQTNYIHSDVKRIQTRIKNQNTNLLTALKYQGVPLTNNLAERSLRPLVITRKLTGGSRSQGGATTHVINMSIIQTIQAQDKPLIPTLKECLYLGATGEG
jgi:transposase